jgi:acetoin utilization deacetylase AcuC-like enzyme
VKAVYTELHRRHDPQFFLVRGVVQRTTEQPERADRLLAGLKAGKHDLVAPVVFGQGPRARIHSPEYLGFLSEAWDAWSALGNAGPEMIANVHPVRHAATYPTHIVGRLGWHTADTACPIGPGTWAAACAATDVATTAAQLVMDGEDAAYALCRPPDTTPIATWPGGSVSSTTAPSPPPIFANATSAWRSSMLTSIMATARRASSTSVLMC